jgi:hypothetical protein
MAEIKIHRSNLARALHSAILLQVKYEKEKLGYTQDSALVAGWREALEAILRGDDIELI